MRDRLIELLEQGHKEYLYYDQIADYLIANGVILPPMKLGQICFEIAPYQNEVRECRVSSITQKADGSFKIRLTNLREKWVYEITEDDIGKTVFLSREDAEAALQKGVSGGVKRQGSS